ncbi:hypothetical protein [Microbulbifer sp. SSSA008]|uniref:hypothetical protein n=1 Tax=unclassified Microbulbifer TaxID=2619833 RepID=UPI00403969DD
MSRISVNCQINPEPLHLKRGHIQSICLVLVGTYAFPGIFKTINKHIARKFVKELMDVGIILYVVALSWGAPVYLEDGSGSFQICSCGFEFGFDDEPSASGTKIDSVIGNWEVKRHRKLQYLSSKSDQYKELLTNLRCIGIELST